ncbi:MAG: sigma-70 family RNA polymerase sigma factor [Planctomycetota bacterium]
MSELQPSADASLDRVEPHLATLRRLVLARVGRDVAEDVVQDVALAAVQSPSFPQEDADQRRWLCRVALRQCALHWRRSGREHTSADTSQCASDALDDPIHWLLARESRGQVAAAIRNIAQDARQLVIDKFVHRKTYEQIASARGITRDAAEYRVQAAKRTLKRAILEQGFESES